MIFLSTRLYGVMTGLNEQPTSISFLASHLSSWICVGQNFVEYLQVLDKLRKFQFKIEMTKSGREKRPLRFI